MNAEQFGRETMRLRAQHGGLIETGAKLTISTPEELATAYTPGVGAACMAIAEDPQKLHTHTQVKDTIAIISDGTAVLGFGNTGPGSVLPVLEGKAIILKQFADVNAVPILLNTTDTKEIIETIERIAMTFGGIMLEDISSPRCFEIEDTLAEKLDMPVFHDDQHGTAIVVLGGLINAAKIIQKQATDLRVVINGAGAAGIAVGKLLRAWGVTDILMLDSRGIINTQRGELPAHKADFAVEDAGDLAAAMAGADVFVGLSKPNLVSQDMGRSMKKDPIIFALANPVPEIMPTDAHAAGAAIVATGRSDFPNQINNALVFPGLFKGLLDKGIRRITTETKLRAAHALAAMVETPTPEEILPGVFAPGLVQRMSDAVQ